MIQSFACVLQSNLVPNPGATRKLLTQHLGGQRPMHRVTVSACSIRRRTSASGREPFTTFPFDPPGGTVTHSKDADLS